MYEICEDRIPNERIEFPFKMIFRGMNGLYTACQINKVLYSDEDFTASSFSSLKIGIALQDIYKC